MSWSSVDEMWTAVRHSLDAGVALIYASSGIELQVEAINNLADVAEQVLDFRKDARERRDEAGAKAAFVMMQWISGVADTLWMWIHIKQDQMESAWDSLVSAQEHLNCGLRFVQNDGLEDLARLLDTFERTLFPPQVFTSSGLTFESAICTICGGVYGDCGHVSGMLYMGEMCGRRLVNIGVDHSAIVDSPADKGCRITAVQNGTHMRCKLTGRKGEEIDPKDGPQGHFKATSILLRQSSKLGVRRAITERRTDQPPVIREEEGQEVRGEPSPIPLMQ